MNKLNKEGDQAFKVISTQLEKWGVEITEARGIEINALAFAIQRYNEKVRYISEHGDVQIANSGYRQQSPEFTQMTKLHELITKHYKELGFYKEREKEKNEEPSEIESLLQKDSRG